MNVILSSAENSSLLQTLSESESKRNPSIYSTQEVYPYSATQWYSITPKSGSSSDGQSQTWDLPKYGILQSMVLSYDKNISYTGGDDNNGVAVDAGDVINVLDRVEFLSSSRILYTLYAEDIVSQLYDLESDQIYGPNATALKPATDVLGAAGSGVETYTVPIVFDFFTHPSTCPNLAFQEPCSLRIVYKNTQGCRVINPGSGTAVTGTTISVGNTKLTLRYKSYGEQDNAQMLASNYEAESLNMLVSRRFRENPQSFTAGAPVSNHKFTLELKNVDVIENYYFMVKQAFAVDALGSQTNSNSLVKINRIRLTASGQELCDLTADQLIYMKLTDYGWPCNNVNLSANVNNISLEHVAKVQTGIIAGHIWTNGWSQREMVNVVAEVFCDLGTGTFQCFCQEKTSAIESISSNTGRAVLSLVN